MNLPDFTEFAAFNELRSKMNAQELGFFELFDPNLHLTGVERSQLERQGLQLDLSRLHQLLDFTLVYKNSRVCVADGDQYHIANCSYLPKAAQVTVFTSIKAGFEQARVCKHCLQILAYKGYDAQKARREHYSQQVFEQFKLETFWQSHHLYPVSEKNQMRKPLNLKTPVKSEPEIAECPS